MINRRTFRALFIGCAVAALGACQTSPPPVVVPASFQPLGVSAPYLLGDVIGGQRARAAKMRAAKIRPLSPYEAGPYMADLDSELRRQTAGIGLDILQVGGSIVVRIPATFTFDTGSAAVKATTDLCTREVPVPGSLPRIIRVLIHCYGEPGHEAQHVYLHDAAALRLDLTGAQ
jgi:chorismate mutase